MESKVEYDLLHPTYKALYDIVGETNLLKIYDLFRGTQLQLPMKIYDRKALKTAISTGKFAGLTNQQIFLKYGYSPRWIRNVRESSKKNNG